MAKQTTSQVVREIKILAVLLLLVIGIIVYLGALKLRQEVAEISSRLFARYVDYYPLPFVSKAPTLDEQKQILARTIAFSTALEEGRDTPPLVLRAQDLSFLLAVDRDIGAALQVTSIRNGRIQALLSLRHIKNGQITYLNGWADLEIALKNGQLLLQPVQMSLGGRELQGNYLDAVRQLNTLHALYDRPDCLNDLKCRVRKALLLLRSVEIRGETVIFQ